VKKKNRARKAIEDFFTFVFIVPVLILMAFFVGLFGDPTEEQ
jgi:hypothetical protein